MTEEKNKPFEDLGKATLRGIRKCPKCGTFNGTRGISCKNLECRQVFKIPKEKVGSDVEVDAVKLVCGPDLQIYSVKFKDIDDAIRCFVHLPIIEGIEAVQDAAEVTVIKQSAAMCYSSSCRKPADDMGAVTLNLNPCSHTQLVVDCVLEAVPLEIKKEVVKIMPISGSIKDEILTLVESAEEHIVQRITKCTMVIKCAPDDKLPLGFLHFSVFEPAKNSKKFKILCECQSQHKKPFVPREKQMCLHFFLCICAFASDDNLIDEFKNLIQCVLNIKSPDVCSTGVKFSELEADSSILKAYFAGDISAPAKKKKTESQEKAVSEENTTKAPKISKKEAAANKQAAKTKFPFLSCIPGTGGPQIDPSPMIYFEEWLASVVERINETMHYQFSGCPEPLIFHVPQAFFDVLQQRISAGNKKRRLPNTVVAFTKKNSLPAGVFSKYTWHINNILHVKRIFDTTLVPLEITRSFVENKDGTYIPYNPVQETLDLAENFRKTLNSHLIKPLELKTFLKVGTMVPNQEEPTPFIIEWIPDVLPKTHVGELRIKFEYGHQRNGIIENREQTEALPSATAAIETFNPDI